MVGLHPDSCLPALRDPVTCLWALPLASATSPHSYSWLAVCKAHVGLLAEAFVEAAIFPPGGALGSMLAICIYFSSQVQMRIGTVGYGVGS